MFILDIIVTSGPVTSSQNVKLSSNLADAGQMTSYPLIKY